MDLSFDSINTLPPDALASINGALFAGLLDSVPVSKRGGSWTKIRPSTLDYLSQEAHEVLLDRLPQCGPMKNRQPGALRVLSLGFNVHIAGSDPRCAYEFDFNVRINGFQAAINVLIQPRVFLDPSKLEGLTLGPRTDFFHVVTRLQQCGLTSLADYELILLKMFRPCCPSGWQWGTTGGMFEESEEKEGAAAARFRGWQETQEEFKGYKIWGWMQVLEGEIYQSGNILEIQYGGATIGSLPQDGKVQLAAREAIVDWKRVPLDEAREYLRHLKRMPVDDPDCIWPDDKISHVLAELIPQFNAAGIQ